MMNIVIEMMRRKGGIIKTLMMVTITTIGLTVSCLDENNNGNDDILIDFTCPNGTTIIGKSTTPNVMACMECNAGYVLSGAAGVGTTCVKTSNAFITVGNFGGVLERSPRGLAAIGNTLYMVGNGFDFNGAFYTLDTNTGVAARIGSATQFDVSEDEPRGLAAIGNTLYMVGDSNDALYTLNITTGIATRIGRATQFGLSENQPRGLAAIGNTLYMVGDSNDALYTVDTNTGVATRVENADQFGLSESNPRGLAAIGDTLYMVGDSNDALYTLNITTGGATRVGSATQFGLSESNPRGLAAIDNTLYMVGDFNDALYKSVVQAVTNNIPSPDSPPTLQNADLGFSGTSITLTYSETLGSNVPSGSDYDVIVDSSPKIVTAVALNGRLLTLTLASPPVASGETVTLSYTPGTNPVQDTAGNNAAALVDQAVTNNIPSPDSPPTLQNADLGVSGTSITLTYNKELGSNVPSVSDYNVLVAGSSKTVTAVALRGRLLTLTLASPPVTSGQTVTLSYTPGTNPVQDTTGNNAAALTNQTVTNNISSGGAPGGDDAIIPGQYRAFIESSPAIDLRIFSITETQYIVTDNDGIEAAPLTMSMINEEEKWFIVQESATIYARYHWVKRSDRIYLCKFRNFTDLVLLSQIDVSGSPSSLDPASSGCANDMPWLRVLPALTFIGEHEEDITANAFNINTQRLTLRLGGLVDFLIAQYDNEAKWFVIIEMNGRFSRYHWSGLLSNNDLHICKFLSNQSTLNAAVDTSTMPNASDLSNGCNGSPWIKLIPPRPPIPPGPPIIEAVQAPGGYAGIHHTCMVRRSDGAAFCWGDNSRRQLGNGSNTHSATPVQVTQSGGTALSNVHSMFVSNRGFVGISSCAIVGAERSLYCWGEDADDHIPLPGIQLSSSADRPNRGRAKKAPRPYDRGVLQMGGAGSAPAEFFCALLDEDDRPGLERERGRVDCWGNLKGSTNTMSPHYNGQLGTPPFLGENDPGSVAHDDPRRASNTCQGNNPPVVDDIPISCNTVVTGGAKAIAVGRAHVCMIIDTPRERNKIQCWGDNSERQAGREAPSMGHAYEPNHFIQFDDGTDITNAIAIRAGDNHTCAIVNRGSDQGAVYCWGDSSKRANGRGANTYQAHPILFRNSDVSGAPFNIPNNTAITGAVFLSSGTNHNCAIVNTNDGNHLFCWGNNIGLGGRGAMLGRPITGSGNVESSSERAVLVVASGRDSNGAATGGARPTSVFAGEIHTCVRYGASSDSFKCFGDGGNRRRLGYPGTMGSVLPQDMLTNLPTP